MAFTRVPALLAAPALSLLDQGMNFLDKWELILCFTRELVRVCGPVFVLFFGRLEGHFGVPGWMPEVTLKDHVPSDATCRENVVKSSARKCLWAHIRTLEGLRGRPATQFARHLGGCD